MTDTILYSRTGHVARLVLNNPQQHNALGNEQLAAMEAHLDRASSDDAVRVLLLTGSGEKTFCAGASLKEIAEEDITTHAFQRIAAKISMLHVPTICAMNGNVFGGGVELALSCDFRIGVDGMRMRVPAARLGLCYPPEGIQRFVNALGTRITRRILVACEEFDSQGLVDIGFVDHMVLRQNLAGAADEWAEQIAGLAPLAVQAMKRILGQAVVNRLDMGVAGECVRKCVESEDLQEGLTAQQEKRSPRFKGR